MRARARFLLFLAALVSLPALGRGDEPAPPQAAGLSEEDRTWLKFVEPIMLDEEKKAFHELAQQYERDAFREEFWNRRERDGLPAPLGPGYRDRYAELLRIADTQYDRFPNDAARMVLRFGEPASIDKLEACTGSVTATFRDLEIWTYPPQGTLGGGRRHFFYRRATMEPRRMWSVGTPDGDVFATASCRKSFAELANDCVLPNQKGDECSNRTCFENCDVFKIWNEISTLQGSATGGQVEASQLLAPAKVSLEGLGGIKNRSASKSEEEAKPIQVIGPSPTARASGPAPGLARASNQSPAPLSPKQALAALPEDDRKWLEFVEPIMFPEEKKAFLDLTQPYERETFQREFWQRREQDNLQPPMGPGYRQRYTDLRELAQTQYDGWPHDAAMMVIYNGEPAAVEKVSCQEYFREDLEIWTYNRVSTLGAQSRRYIFYRTSPGAPRKMWSYGDSERDIFTPNACRKSFQELYRECPESVQMPPSACPLCAAACDLYKLWNEIRARQGSMAGGGLERGQLFQPQKVSLEGLEGIKSRSASASDPKARTIGVQGPSSAATAPPPEKPAEGAAAATAPPPDKPAEGAAPAAAPSPEKPAEGAAPAAAPSPEKPAEGAAAAAPSPAAPPGAAPGAASSQPPAGAPDKPGAAAAVAGAPAPTRRKLSKKEIRELTEALPPKYREFVDLVDLIMTDDERQVFLQIGDDYQKDRFIEQFWKRRSIDKGGLRTDFKSVYIQRWQIAKEQFQHMNSERARLFLVNGPPDALINIDCVDIYVPVQIWYYERLEALKSKVYLIFYKTMGVGEYRLWLPLDGERVLLAGGNIGLGAAGRRIDVTQCPEWRTIRQAMSYSSAVLGSGAMSMAGASLLFQPPTVETEGVDQILSMTTDLAANAANLDVTKLIRFPDERGNKIGVDLSLIVPRADLKSRQLGEEVFYNVDVIGEVVKDERLIDNFKYRFDIPTEEVGGEKIPLTVRRYLYPGEYKIILKISDGNQSAEGRITDSIKVPEHADEPPPLEAAARAQGRASIAKNQEAGLLPSAISLLPIAKEIATGLQRFETKAAEGVTAVDFYLNGAKVMTRTRAPFDADLNLGPLPRKQIIRVVAYGPTGRAVGEDEYIVNEGREVFRVRILTPEKGAKATGPTSVAAAVAVPEGKALQKVEFYSNETRVATLYQAPWEQTINLRDTKSLGYVRVVGTLEDGTVAEDVRYVNAPSYISEITVDAVELYTSVIDKNDRPVSGLQASNFKVFEDGAIQKIESFEYVKNVPLSLGVIVDTSASMIESLPEAQQAAISFLDFSIGPKDRGFTISFDNEPYVLSKLTNRKDKLYRSLAGLRAEGSTALYDAIVYGLYQFTGVKGKKALVILSDGKDTASKFDYDTLLEYVRKSGISIYAIGLKIPNAELDVKYKLNKLAQVTGGQTFMIDSVKNLESVYRQINDELRSQYLLTYYSTNVEAKDKWRKVEVKVEPTSLQARTLSGYYP